MNKQRIVVGLSGGVDSAVSAWLLKKAGHEVVGLFMKNWEDDDRTDGAGDDRTDRTGDDGAAGTGEGAAAATGAGAGDDANRYCSANADFVDAAAVADVLGIEIEHVNFAAEYRERVFAEFLREYSCGRTPNPDVLCNAEIKFKAFLDHALRLGAETIATGHYARVRWVAADAHLPDAARLRWVAADPRSPDAERVRPLPAHALWPEEERARHRPPQGAASGSGRFELLKGLDPLKDQSYFLHRLNQAQLSRTLFPVGELPKTEVRRIAAQIGLPNAQKKDSTGICFIGERPFREFLNRYLKHQPGPIRDERGRTLGRHVGLSFYTLGQRQGLGIGGVKERGAARGSADHEPWYVAGKDLAANVLQVVQGHDHPALQSRALLADDCSWVAGAPPPPGAYAAKSRYRQADARCTLSWPVEGGMHLDFEAPQWAVTPGQSAVLYDGEVCLGGGVIQRAEPWAPAAAAAGSKSRQPVDQ